MRGGGEEGRSAVNQTQIKGVRKNCRPLKFLSCFVWVIKFLFNIGIFISLLPHVHREGIFFVISRLRKHKMYRFSTLSFKLEDL